MIGLLLIMVLAIFGVAIAIVAFYLVGLWKLFKKAGKEGWEAIIPFYNTWVLAEISGIAWWYALIIIIANAGIIGGYLVVVLLSLASFVANFFIYYNLSKKFHRGAGTAVLLLFFPFVMIPLMGFSKSYQYDRSVRVSENGPIGENGNNNEFDTNNSNSYYHETNSETSANYTEVQYCQYCGKQVIVGSRFCGNCGKEIKK